MKVLHKIKSLEIEKPKFTARQLLIIQYTLQRYTGNMTVEIRTNWGGRKSTKFFPPSSFWVVRYGWSVLHNTDPSIPIDWSRVLIRRF